MSKSLSLIIPVYNAEATLDDCLGSILPQLSDDMELLLIDDGSTDRSWNKCQQYSSANTNIKAFHQENAGASAARNTGLDKASGTWVTFVDSDDMVSDGYLNIEYRKNCDMILKGYTKVLWSGESLNSDWWLPETSENVNIDQYLAAHITDFSLRGPVQKFYKRNLIAGLRFPLKLKVGEDTCFVMRYLAQCRSLFISRQGHYIVRTHENSVAQRYKASTEYASEQLKYVFEAFKELDSIHSLPSEKLLEMAGFYKAVSRDDWKHSPKLWFKMNKEVYSYMMPGLHIKNKLRLKASQLQACLGISR